jgi:RNAse (barnase) inhibitor barstar
MFFFNNDNGGVADSLIGDINETEISFENINDAIKQLRKKYKDVLHVEEEATEQFNHLAKQHN